METKIRLRVLASSSFYEKPTTIIERFRRKYIPELEKVISLELERSTRKRMMVNMKWVMMKKLTIEEKFSE
ncbi:putative late blight resistance protein R1A-10 [Salvia divinorum]|uniref:Late blight resistance protein R1A-10 n=1 Tax=Salvia divinorum TaxID=28513 RepID=A0ABD1GBU4_SALDI